MFQTRVYLEFYPKYTSRTGNNDSDDLAFNGMFANDYIATTSK